MKISAYIHGSRIGDPTTGVGKHMINMVLGVAARGVDVRVLMPRRDLDSDGRIGTYSILRGTPVTPLPWSRWMHERAWALTRHPRVDRWAQFPDWVYCPAEVYIPSRAPLATTFHCVNWFEKDLPWYNDSVTRKMRPRLKIRFNQILKRSARVLTVSEFLKGRIVELFNADPAKITVIGNGAEQAYYDIADQPRDLLIAKEKNPYVVIVGGLTTRKGADFIFPVAEELAKRNSDLEFRVAGYSEPQFQNRFQQHPNIVYAGFLGLDKLPQLVRGAAALMFLSRYETFGIPAIEAMAAGTPVVVSSFAALPEIVGDAGFVMDPAKPAEIADVLIALSRDASLRDRYAALGRARAEQFRWSVCVDRLLNVLK